MKKKNVSKMISMFTAAAMTVGMMTSAAAADIDTEGKDNQFTMLASYAITLDQYKNYNEYPAIEYWLDQEWDANGDGVTTKLDIDIWAPTAGAEQDYVNTLISTGDYPDILNLQYATQSAGQMYEDGWTLDLTDYVEAYMPNYLAWLDRVGAKGTVEIDGEPRYIQIYCGLQDLAEPWGGLMYRRDWIVKYAVDSETGEPCFHGEWVEKEDGTKDWVDDVVFPSGETSPVTISDWEWMFEIFQPYLDGLKENGLNGYCTQLGYAGLLLMGDMFSGFGSGASFYYDENGDVAFGGTSDSMRAYTECMTNWYKNGWIDPNFAERAGDMFFMIDAASVYTGIVGAWYGLDSQLLDGLAGDGSNPLTADAVVLAAATPINDKYGDESVQNKVPTSFYAGSYVGCPWVITDNAEDKDIATLLTAIDYFYSMEGSKVFERGLSDEIMASANGDEDWYNKYVELGLPNGAYTLSEDGIPIIDPSLIYDNNNRNEAAVAFRLLGASFNTAEKGHTDLKKAQYAEWMKYEATGNINADITNQLSAEDSTAYSAFNSNYLTAIAQWVPQYIMGLYDVTDDAQWEQYTAEIDALDWQTQVERLQAIVDSFK